MQGKTAAEMEQRRTTPRTHIVFTNVDGNPVMEARLARIRAEKAAACPLAAQAIAKNLARLARKKQKRLQIAGQA